MSVQQQNKNGDWEDAIEEPYYPSVVAKFLHLFGYHIYAEEYNRRMFFMDGSMLPRKCLICGHLD